MLQKSTWTYHWKPSMPFSAMLSLHCCSTKLSGGSHKCDEAAQWMFKEYLQVLGGQGRPLEASCCVKSRGKKNKSCKNKTKLSLPIQFLSCNERKCQNNNWCEAMKLPFLIATFLYPYSWENSCAERGIRRMPVIQQLFLLKRENKRFWIAKSRMVLITDPHQRLVFIMTFFLSFVCELSSFFFFLAC